MQGRGFVKDFFLGGRHGERTGSAGYTGCALIASLMVKQAARRARGFFRIAGRRCLRLRTGIAFPPAVRTHQTLGGETPILELVPPPETTAKDTKLSARPILGGLYHEYQKAA